MLVERNPAVRNGIIVSLVLWGFWLAAFSASASETVLNGQRFQFSDGWGCQVAAAPPEVLRPICVDFDYEGRLYVAESSGSNEPVQVQLEKKPHRILCLEDRDQDGYYETSRVFADQMMFPQGVLYHDGSVYVAAPPSIWKLTDTDGDGVADQREEWFAGKTLTGCANDLHGPYLGRDGWIYWCKGAFAEQVYPREGRPAFRTRAAHIFRRHPVNGEIEPVMTGGMDNPVEVVFTLGGERIFTTTFLQHPGGGKRDGLIHAIYGGVYGKAHDVLQGHWRTGDLMPVLVHLGPAAPCGLALPDADWTGLSQTLLACSFNLHKVTAHRLIPSGASFITEDSDWFVSDNVDFHPTDVIEDADGSLLVVDTGGWYKICCPTSHLYKPDVLGAIYRLRRANLSVPDDPWGRKLDWAQPTIEELVARLADRRPQVVRRAQLLLRKHGASACPNLRRAVQSEVPRLKLNAVWTSAGIAANEARWVARLALHDTDPLVRQAACHVVGLWRDADALDALVRCLSDDSFAVRRASAEALGRLHDPRAVPYLLQAVESCTDRVLEHSLIYACLEIGLTPDIQASLIHHDVQRRRAALVILDQLQPDRLDPIRILEWLQEPDASIQDSALWVLERHAEWAGQLAARLVQQLDKLNPDAPEAVAWQRLLVRYAAQPALHGLVAEHVGQSDLPANVRRYWLTAMAAAQIKAIPQPWISAFQGLLRKGDPELVAAVVETILAWKRRQVATGALRSALVDVAHREDLAAQWRVKALAACDELPALSSGLVAFVAEQLNEELPLEQRLAAADVLATAPLDADQLRRLLGRLESLGPIELARLLPAFGRCNDPALGQALVERLEQAPSARGIPVATLRTIFEKYDDHVTRSAESLYKKLDAETAAQLAKLDPWLESLPTGDIRRGQAIFYGSRAACSSCHAIGYLGGNIGPDLTRIGQIRSRRDLFESIVFPSASFVRSYEPVIVTTTDGLIYNGIIRNESAAELTLVLAADKFVTLPRQSVESIVPSRISIMPAGLEKQLTDQELADLLAFLEASR